MNSNLEISAQNSEQQTIETISPTTREDTIIKIVIVIIVSLTVFFSWAGYIDQGSEKFIDTSLKQAAVVYATARAINATVSILQTFDFPLIGLGVGQGLDPINSIVERFSLIMEIAIGSLVIQKILIEITTSNFFSILLTISTIPIYYSLLYKEKLSLNFSIKIFTTFLFLRFAVILALALNGLVSSYFIENKISSEAEIINQASTEAESQVQEYKNAKGAIKELKNKTTIIDDDFSNVPPHESTSYMDKFKDFFRSSDNNSVQPSAIDDSAQVTKLQKLKFWLKEQQDKLSKTVDKFNPLTIADKIDKVVGNMINIMAIILFQTLFLPIFLLYLIKWITLRLWNINIQNLYLSIRSNHQNAVG